MFPPGPAIAVAVLAPFLGWRIYVRFRRASGRQRLTKYRAPVTLTVYALLVAAVALANLRRPVPLAAFTAALAIGAGLAAFALARTRFEPTRGGLFYRPFAPIGVALAILFLARVAYRLVEFHVVDPAAARDALEFGQSPLTIGAFGLLAGYQFWYVLGLARWRRSVLDAKRRREANRSHDGE